MADLINSGLELMLAGMGIVYIFLAMLVVMINLMSSVVQRYFPERPSGLHLSAGNIDKTTIAAITAAVHQYRQHRHQQNQS
jgi:oxaloacetate decarboxylase (Na+ extruding) subunit gamma